MQTSPQKLELDEAWLFAAELENSQANSVFSSKSSKKNRLGLNLAIIDGPEFCGKRNWILFWFGIEPHYARLGNILNAQPTFIAQSNLGIN